MLKTGQSYFDTKGRFLPIWLCDPPQRVFRRPDSRQLPRTRPQIGKGFVKDVLTWFRGHAVDGHLDVLSQGRHSCRECLEVLKLEGGLLVTGEMDRRSSACWSRGGSPIARAKWTTRRRRNGRCSQRRETSREEDRVGVSGRQILEEESIRGEGAAVSQFVQKCGV